MFNGPIALAVNYAGHTPRDILFAGLTDAISGFISTGITARIVQHFSPIKNRVCAYFGGSLVPVTISFTTSFVTNYATRNAHKHKILEKLYTACIMIKQSQTNDIEKLIYHYSNIFSSKRIFIL